MKKLFVMGLVLLFGALAFGQTVLTNTTLAAAVASSYTTTVVVSSATGISAPSATDSTKATFIYVDRELMDVRAISSTTLTVVRGAGGTVAASHASGAFVFVIPAYLSTAVMKPPPNGACTRANEVALPRIEPVTGRISDCNGGQWINGDSTQTQRTQAGIGLRFPNPGGTAYTALETNGTAASAATELYCTEINLPYSMVITGLGVLNGTTVGTNKHYYILYDAGGKVLGYSTTSGTTTANASTYQKIALTKPFYAVGPARYFACEGLNGTTDTIRHAVTATNDNVLGGAVTGQTQGTPVAITVPSSFTTAKAPYWIVY